MKPALFLLLAVLQTSILSQTGTGTIAGVVRGVDGAPATNVRISAMEIPEQDGANVAPTVAGFGQTDAAGRYRIEGLRPGRYFILAGPLDFPTYYPGVAQRITATPVSVVAGAVLDTLSFSLSAATQSGIIQVVVQHAGDRTPVEGASITIRPLVAASGPASISAKTDANGQWTIGGLVAPGQYGVTAESEGLVGNSTGGRTQVTVSAQVTLTAEQNESRVVLPMATGVTIDGRVQYVSGQPIAGARVSVLQLEYQDGRRALVTEGSTRATTDANGNYKLTVGPGLHYLQVTNRAQTRGNTPQTAQTTYYPGVIAFTDAKTLKADKGEKLTANITIPNQPGFTISGTIINPLPGGRPNAAGGVNRTISTFYLIPRNTDAVVDTVAIQYQNVATARFQNGSNTNETPFEFRGVTAGDYELYPIYLDNSSPPIVPYTARTPITVRDKDIANLSITMRPNIELKGRFVIDGDVGPIVWPSVRMQLRQKEILPTATRGRFQLGAQAGSNAPTFTVSEVWESIFDIVVAGLPTNIYVADIRQGNRSVIATGVDMRNGSGDPVEIVLRSGVGTIAGTVRTTGNQPTTILIRPARLTQVRQLYRSSRVANNGQFTVEGVAPGDYVVYAFSPVSPAGAELNDDYMKQYESLGRPITVTALKATRVELTVIDDPSLMPATSSPESLPQISNRVILTADTPISAASSVAANSPRGFQRGAAATARGATPVPTVARGGAPAVSAEIEQNLALNPTTPAERAQLIAFLQRNGQERITSDRITAERLFLKGQVLEPNNPRWASQLG